MESKSLKLYGDRLSYRTAFLNSRLRPPSGPRIYQGTGTVFKEENSFVIEGAEKWLGPQESADEESHLRVIVTINRGAKLPKMHRELASALENAAISKSILKWSAYGQVERYGNTIILNLKELDHLYIEYSVPLKPTEVIKK